MASLKASKKKAKEGDVLIFEAFMKADCMGIFIYDRFMLYPLTWHETGIGELRFRELVVTDEVQCISNFPIDWWDDFPFMSKIIPFDVSKHLSDLDVGDVKLFTCF